jgi:SP family general alpha glucoside:H+ symporter-like MFS transporter
MATALKDIEVPVEVRKLSTQQDAEEIREAIETEHALTFREALRLYPKAIGWSMYFSLGVIMLCKSSRPLQPTLFTNTTPQHSTLNS